MGFRLFRKTPEVTISVEGLRTSRGVFAANISRIAEIPRAMAPRVMRIPSGAASAPGNKLAGQKKFHSQRDRRGQDQGWQGDHIGSVRSVVLHRFLPSAAPARHIMG